MPDPAGEEGALRAPSRILLVGFMASGKTSVGREVARMLDWQFVDFDDEIRRAAGEAIPDIFARLGEAGFRAIEARAARRLVRLDNVVLAAGGGWAAQAGHMESLADDTLSVWLKVTPETAVSRARAQGAERPLLDVARPVQRARLLLATRTPYYRLARLTLDSEGISVTALAERIARVATRTNATAIGTLATAPRHRS